MSARGICWGTTTNPTTDNNKISAGTGLGGFYVSITGLTCNTTYYVRAFATNSAGTSYGTTISFKSSFSSIRLFKTGLWYDLITDIDDNLYKAITIGTQTWMAENLKTTKYNDGTAIPFVTDGVTWANLSTPAYCWYDNDESTYKSTFGALYNWFAVNTGKLCPTGWHIPTNNEWTKLITFLGGNNEAGDKLKETGTTHWNPPNTGATNESGFTALPGGARSPHSFVNMMDVYGKYIYIQSDGFFWQASSGHYYNIKSSANEIFVATLGINAAGFSVRCVKDN